RLFSPGNGGWSGGDGTLSIPLPDGRTVWLFGDSLLGAVAPDRSRASDAPFVRNCLVVQSGFDLQTHCRDANGGAVDTFPSGTPAAWYWPAHGLTVADRLLVFLHRFESTGPELWQWRWTGNALARFSLPELHLERITAAPSANGILYGVTVLEHPPWVYIFGTDDRPFPQQAHLARVASGRIDGPWHYFDGRQWSGDPAASVPILSGVSTQYAVLAARDAFYLFTMDGREPFSHWLVAYRAHQPWGPWHGPLPLYPAPSDEGRVAVYNPFVHPQFTDNGRVLVSYNRNPIDDPDALYRDADLYRPRFVWVDLAAVDAQLPEVR
ncbi:MAG: DUF5005 domain-containing protein, partial [Desulfatitalea sp.]|nr:DUF5005 domain-containing protein [Desulfatitalea sp.]